MRRGANHNRRGESVVGGHTDLGGPLDDTEIAMHLARFEAIGFGEAERDRMRVFAKSDGGRPLPMT